MCCSSTKCCSLQKKQEKPKDQSAKTCMDSRPTVFTRRLWNACCTFIKMLQLVFSKIDDVPFLCNNFLSIILLISVKYWRRKLWIPQTEICYSSLKSMKTPTHPGLMQATSLTALLLITDYKSNIYWVEFIGVFVLNQTILFLFKSNNVRPCHYWPISLKAVILSTSEFTLGIVSYADFWY